MRINYLVNGFPSLEGIFLFSNFSFSPRRRNRNFILVRSLRINALKKLFLKRKNFGNCFSTVIERKIFAGQFGEASNLPIPKILKRDVKYFGRAPTACMWVVHMQGGEGRKKGSRSVHVRCSQPWFALVTTIIVVWYKSVRLHTLFRPFPFPLKISFVKKKKKKYLLSLYTFGRYVSIFVKHVCYNTRVKERDNLRIEIIRERKKCFWKVGTVRYMKEIKYRRSGEIFH